MEMKDFYSPLHRWLAVASWSILVLFISTGIGSVEHSEQLLRPFLERWGSGQILFWTDDFHSGLRKLAHLVQFFIFAVLVWRAARVPPAWPLGAFQLAFGVLALCLLLSILSEAVQMLTPNREARVEDVLLNMGGAALAVSLLVFLDFLRGFPYPLKPSKKWQYRPVSDRTPRWKSRRS